MSRNATLYRLGGSLEIVGDLPFAQAGVSGSFTFTGRGGLASYSFSSTSLPAGWVLNTAGVMTWTTPAAVDTHATIFMSDAARNAPVSKRIRIIAS